MLKTVPRLFFKYPKRFKHLAGNRNQCILYKTLSMNSEQGTYFVSQHVITLVLKGKKTIQTEDGSVLQVKAGQFAYIPRDLYMIQDIIPENGEFESWLFFFDDQLVEQFLSQSKAKIANANSFYQPNIIDQKITPVILPHSIHTKTFIQGLSSLLGNINTLSPELVSLKTMELLLLLTLDSDGNHLINQLQLLRSKERRSITAFMEKHYTKALKVEDYAYLTGRSLSTFLRDFKRHYHTTPKKWLKEKRLTHAKELFNQQNYSVTDAAFEVGYENISHFIRGFKEKYQLSPKQYLIQLRTQKRI